MFLSYISLITFILCVIMGTAGLMLDPKARLNRAFAFYVFIISFWAFADIFYNIVTDEKAGWFWQKIETIGWCGMFFALIYLCLVFSNYYEKTPLFIKIIIVALPIAFIIANWIKPLYVLKFSNGPYGKIEYIDVPSFGFFFVTLESLLSTIIGIYLIFRSRQKSSSKRYRAQSKIFMIILIVSSSAGIFLNIGTNMLNINIPPLGPAFVLIIIAGTLFLIYKYRLLRLDFGIFADKTADALSDMILIISPLNKIIKLNKKGESMLGIRIDKENKHDISDFFNSPELVKTEIDNAVDSRNDVYSKYFILKGAENKAMPVYLSVYPVIDKFDDYIGSILICKILCSFEEILDRYNITAHEVKVILFLMQGLNNREIGQKLSVSEGTVKNYIFSIFKKTNSSNRIELVQLFFPFQ